MGARSQRQRLVHDLGHARCGRLRRRAIAGGHRKALLEAAAKAGAAALPDQILAFDAAAARHYGKVVGHRDRAGTPIDGFDAQIVSICRANDAALITRNVKDFADTGIVLIDPWQSLA